MTQYDWTGIAAKFYTSPKTEVRAFLGVGLFVILLFLFFHGPVVTDRVESVNDLRDSITHLDQVSYADIPAPDGFRSSEANTGCRRRRFDSAPQDRGVINRKTVGDRVYPAALTAAATLGK